MHNGCISEGRADLEGEAWERRQKRTTWKFVALAAFVTAGMAEWSRRSAADEVIVDEKILQQAIQIAAEARDSGIKGLRDSESGKRISDFGFRNSDSGKNLSDLGVSAVKSLATAEAQNLLRRGYAGQGRGGVVHSGGNDAATIQTSGGGNQ